MKSSPFTLLRKLASKLASRVTRPEQPARDEADADSPRLRATPKNGFDNRRLGIDDETEKVHQTMVGTPLVEVSGADDHVSDVYSDSTQGDLRHLAEQSETPVSIDHFEIRRVLGQGGFGSVFLAYDTRLDRMVAIKLLDRLEKSAARRMLDYETRAASKLKHPNLVTVFQSGEHKRGCYIVFEYVPGPEPEKARTLRELLSIKKRISPKKAVEFIRQVTEALDYAHSADVVHRDIKPENILVDFKGVAYLADFGCARQNKRHIEGVNSLVGTLPYMSLEQINGKWNSRTDIWSIGVVLYELLAGKRPFEFAEKVNSRTAAEAAFSYAVAVLDAKQLAPIEGVDEDLLAICQKCLQPHGDDRYQSASDVATDLARWQRKEPVSCRPLGIVERFRRWTLREPIIASLLGVIVLSLLGGFVISSSLATKMWTTRKTYVRDQVTGLDQVDATTFVATLDNLQNEPFHKLAVDDLSEMFLQVHESSTTKMSMTDSPSPNATPRIASQQHNRLAAALVTFDRTERSTKPPRNLVELATEHLQHEMLLTDDPLDFQFLRDHLLPGNSTPQHRIQQSKQIDQLWRLTEHPDSQTRFHALAALAECDPNNERWSGQSAELAKGILGQEQSKIAGWAAAIANVADRLLPLFQAEIDNASSLDKFRAEVARAVLARTPTELAKRIVNASSPAIASELLLQLKTNTQTVDERKAIHDVLSETSEGLEPRQLANQLLARLYLDGPLLGVDQTFFDAATASDHGARTDASRMFELGAVEAGLTIHTVSQWIGQLLTIPTAMDAVQSALLALGHFDIIKTAESARQPIIEQVLDIHRSSPHAGIHSAAERVLRQWMVPVPKVERTTFADVENPWRVNSLGQLLNRSTLPNGRSFEVTAYEVTLAEYATYVRSRAEYYSNIQPDRMRVVSWLRSPIVGHFNSFPHDKNDATSYDETNIPEAHQRLPVRHVSALQAVAYSVWASQQDGIPENQWCFEISSQDDSSNLPLLDAIEAELASTYTSVITGCDQNQHGYRLPFADEWEQLVDPLPTTAALMDDAGWYRENSLGHVWPVGGKRPNQRGIFDLHGNVSEWYLRMVPNQDGSERAELGMIGASFDTNLGEGRRFLDGSDLFSGNEVIGYRLFRVLE